MWRLCALCALLVSPVRVRSSVCDNGQSNIHVDLPNESVYLCHGDYFPSSSQVYPSIATKYTEEETYHACMDVIINHTASIPNSGAHRPIGAKYGEYIYCPPQRWVHNLQHAGVAFLYHPCVVPQLKGALSFVARSCVSRHVITPLPSLSRERPIALATWCSTLEMSHINVTEIWNWLKDNVSHRHQHKSVQDGAYQHLLFRPSLMSESADLCGERYFQMHNHLLNYRGWPVRRLLRKRRRAVLFATPVVGDIASSHVSSSSSSSTAAGQHVDKTNKQPAGSSVVPSPTESFSSPSSVSLTQDLNIQGINAGVHSREIQENDKDNMVEFPKKKTIATAGNRSQVLPDVNVTQPVGSNVSLEPSKKLPQVMHKDHPADSSQKETSINLTARPDITPQSQHPLTGLKLSATAEKEPLGGLKQECSCQNDIADESSAKAQKRLAGSLQKSSEGFVSTPRTEEATWAAASLILLFSLLTFSVLYTQIYKKFRKSQSLYWASGYHSEEKETVSSIVKRRLVQGHSGRKKWFGKKKSPTVLYESLSESSD